MTLTSIDPATGDTVWQGTASSVGETAYAVAQARAAFPGWALTPLDKRIALIRRFGVSLDDHKAALAETISRETGKPRWEALGEVGSMIGKIGLSIAAQAERAGERSTDTDFGRAVLRHRPHGVMAVLGPYNFPGHLPNGHIVPALLAGNTVIFKPSEETPATGAAMAALWEEAGLPPNVFTIVQGGRNTGAALVASGAMPFGGVGASGNHRPSAYYAADYCAFPVANFEAEQVADLSFDIRGAV